MKARPSGTAPGSQLLPVKDPMSYLTRPHGAENGPSSSSWSLCTRAVNLFQEKIRHNHNPSSKMKTCRLITEFETSALQFLW